MALDPDRIRQLAEDDSIDLPPISAAQADETVRIMAASARQERRLLRAV